MDSRHLDFRIRRVLFMDGDYAKPRIFVYRDCRRRKIIIRRAFGNLLARG